MANMMNVPVVGLVENMSYLKCPDCGKILPLNPKACDGCGHSFVRKTVKAKKAKPVDLAKLYRILLWALSGAMLVCQIVFVCLDAVRITVPDVLDLHASGLGLFAYFSGGELAGLTEYLDLFKLTEENIIVALLGLQAAGVLYLAGLICTLIYALVTGFNLLHFGSKSVRHMTLWAAIAAGLDLLASVLSIACGAGLAILLGVAEGDEKKDAEVLAGKIARLRIFTDENDKMNLSVCDVGGEALVVSNFTLLANYSHGNRPEYMRAARPDEANALYETFCDLLSGLIGKPVGKGVFGAHMQVDIAGDGPVTIVMDSKVLIK